MIIVYYLIVVLCAILGGSVFISNWLLGSLFIIIGLLILPVTFKEHDRLSYKFNEKYRKSLRKIK